MPEDRPSFNVFDHPAALHVASKHDIAQVLRSTTEVTLYLSSTESEADEHDTSEAECDTVT